MVDIRIEEYKYDIEKSDKQIKKLKKRVSFYRKIIDALLAKHEEKRGLSLNERLMLGLKS